MMHEQIDDQTIERYARNQLESAERLAFEEHYFACEECFEKLQAMELFIAGVRDASARGLLEDEAPGSVAPRNWTSWLLPALGLSTCAAVVLAVVAVKLWYVQLPALQKRLTEANGQLAADKQARALLEEQLSRRSQAEINLPLVMLQSTRGAESAPNEVILPPGAQHLALWIELPSGSGGTFRLELDTYDGRKVEVLENLTRNTYGALAVSLPAEALQSGLYSIRLSREVRPPGTLLAEYRLRIRRP